VAGKKGRNLCKEVNKGREEKIMGRRGLLGKRIKSTEAEGGRERDVKRRRRK